MIAFGMNGKHMTALPRVERALEDQDGLSEFQQTIVREVTVTILLKDLNLVITRRLANFLVFRKYFYSNSLIRYHFVIKN